VHCVIHKLDNEDLNLENSAVYGVYVAIESKATHGAQSIPSREIIAVQ
jgi:hypothetical protein